MAGTGVFPAEIAIVPTPDDQTVQTATQEQNFINWVSACYQLPGAQAFQSVTLSSDDVTPNRSFIKVDTQAAAATDNLAHIIQTNLEAGRLLFVRAADTNRTVVIKNAQGGAGQILTLDGADYSLDDDKKVSVMLRESTSWVEIFRFYGNDLVAWRTFLGLGTAAVANRGTTAGSSPIQLPAVDDIYGLKSIWLPATSWEPSTTGGCSTIQKQEFTAGNAEGLFLDFDGAAGESAFQWVAFPKHWNNGTVDARFYYIVDAAVSTGVVWGIRGVSVADNETADATQGTLQVIADTYLGTAKKMAITSYTPAVTIAGTPADAELVCLRVFRDPTSGSDTTTQDARLFGVQLRYTANKLNDS